MLRDGDQSTADQVAHLRCAPEYKDDDGGGLAGQIPPEGACRAEIHEEEQHHLGHDPDELQIDPEDRFHDPVVQRHQHTQQDAQRDADEDGDEADLQRHPEAPQQADHILALEQDVKTQIRHSEASFPASCPAGTPAAG